MHGAWSKYSACPAFMAHPSWHVVKTFCMPFVHGSGDGCPATYFHDKKYGCYAFIHSEIDCR